MGVIHSLRNMLQPVNRLPPEILSHVARCIPDEDETDASSIIPVTHVCRYWRNSITSTPENWTRVSSKRIGIAELSLNRCKAAPLDLWIHVGQGGITPGFSDLITPYIQNIKHLNVYSFSPQEKFFQTFEDLLPLTPNLQSLTLFGGMVDAPLDRPNDPCGQLLSSLTSLYLSSVPLYPSFLRLTTLKDFTIHHNRLNLRLDTLLDFLEQNRSLERAEIDVKFTQDSLLDLRRRAPIKNRLRHLSISSHSAVDLYAFISNIVIQKGAHLELGLFDQNTGPEHARSVVSTVHQLNPRSYTSMEYRPIEGSVRTIQLHGPDGSFSLKRRPAEAPFTEFPLPTLNNIQTFHLKRNVLDPRARPRFAPTSLPLSFLPALEMLVIEREMDALHLLWILFSNPSSSRSLKTLAFFDCYIDDEFMRGLIRFSSNRKGKSTTSAPLHRVVIVNSGGRLPPFTLIDELGKYVPVVDVRVGKVLPSDLRWNGPVE